MYHIFSSVHIAYIYLGHALVFHKNSWLMIVCSANKRVECPAQLILVKIIRETQPLHPQNMLHNLNILTATFFLIYGLG